MKAVLIPGDGIGKEISKSVVDITKAMKLDIEWVEYQAGAEYAATTKFLNQDLLMLLKNINGL